jgi:phosphatidylglycerophosphatase A
VKFNNIISSRPWLKDIDYRQPYLWVATWLGCGLLVPASGTWGTLGALPVGLIFLKLGGAPFLFVVTLLLIPAGLWASRRFHEETKTEDCSAVVIDEAAGMWLALLPTGMNPVLIAAAFVLFRLFDIWKPWPISYLDSKLPGEWGVMADDLLAGVYAAVGVYILGAYAGIN